MIQLKIEKKCENCNEFEAKQFDIKMYAGEVMKSDKIIMCKYKDICRRIEKMLREQKNEEVQG